MRGERRGRGRGGRRGIGGVRVTKRRDGEAEVREDGGDAGVGVCDYADGGCFGMGWWGPGGLIGGGRW